MDPIRRAWLIASLLAVWVGLTPAPAMAARGDLDETFSRDGVVHGQAGGTPSVAAQADGGIVVTNGDFVTRYTADGALDKSFAGDGVGAVPVGSHMSDVAVTPDGSILLAGVISTEDGRTDAVLVRLRPEGFPDPSFGDDGTVTVVIGDDVGDSEQVREIAIMPDGRIVAAATVFDQLGPRGAVIRLLPNGALDPSLSGDGRQLLAEPGVGQSVALRPDGSILLGGSAGYSQLRLAQLLPDGTPDPGFGGGGSIASDLLGSAESIDISPDGSIYVDGRHCRQSSDCSWRVVRYTSSGAIDTAFGDDGVVRNVPGQSLALDRAGGILVAGQGSPWRNFRPTVVVSSLRPSGRPDQRFAHDGTAFAYSGQDGADATDLATTADGEVVVAGWRADGRLALARFEGSGRRSDADADGVTDRRDRCDLRHSERRRGCPRVPRRFSVVVTKDNGWLTGRLAAADVRACRRKQKIEVFRVRPGADRRISAGIGLIVGRVTGRWVVRRSLPDGRYRALATAYFDERGRGYCSSARTQWRQHHGETARL